MAAGGGGAGRPSVLLRHYTPIIAVVHAYAFDVACYGEVRQVVSEPCWEEIRGFLHPIIYMYVRCLYWFGPNVWPLIA